ncbi:MAG: hypothetical protein AB7P37_10950 [Ramlibacter sp.]
MKERLAWPVSQYARAQVQSAYLLAAASVEKAVAVAAPVQDTMAPVAAAQEQTQEQVLSYAPPSDAELLASDLPSRAGDTGLPAPGVPAALLQVSADVMKNDQELALSEGEELEAGDGSAGTQSLQQAFRPPAASCISAANAAAAKVTRRRGCLSVHLL